MPDIKNRHLGTIAQLCRATFATKARIDNRKKLVKQQCLPTCLHNMVKFRLLAAEICWRVWGTRANFNGFRILAALPHGCLVVGVSQTLRHWTEGATYIRQGGRHVGHWPTFIVMVALCNRADHYIFMLWFVLFLFPRLISAVGDWMSTIVLHMVWL